MADAPLDSDELVLKRVPPGLHWLKPGPRLTNANFSIRSHLGEKAVSVSRKQLTSPKRLLELVSDEVVQRLGPRSAWHVAEAHIADIRALGFEVVPDPTPDDPGHALIQPGQRDFGNVFDRRHLAALFRIAPVPFDE
ncbi:MAG TPA: hypothetical protein VML55_13310 [Planctomycetaceae bacterium]|nr:hypothetical protein [Planctomycetaceae bacterium]